MKIWQPELFKSYEIAGFFSEKIPKASLNTLKISIFFPRQIHSDKVIILNSQNSDNSWEGDGVITFQKGVFIGVQTSDCVPILIADKKKRMVAAIHAGWRGTVKGILSKALEKIINLGIKPEDLLLAFGPHIQGSCYEVREDIFSHLKSPFKEEPFLVSKGDRFYLNLAAINLFQAQKWNIPKENIWLSSECTHCSKEKYHSYRRERNYSYTQIAFISSQERGLP